MTDPRNELKKKFEVANRYPNFGDALMRMDVQGFRSHSGTLLEVRSPITAFSGVNGVGKSTLLQVAAVAFKRPGNERNYYLSEFLAKGPLDPRPFEEEARVEFGYWQEDRDLIRRTVSWNESKSRWRYPRSRPERAVFFAGVGLYLPKVEQRDVVVRNARYLSVGGSNPVADEIRKSICHVLGCEYDGIHTRDVSYKQRSSEVASVDREGTEYSEAHMGFGEGRIQYLIRTLERLPAKSLILIEEPETSLHLSAQHRFGSYLVEVSNRRGHQVFVTTHSEQFLSSLPSESRVFLKRDTKGVTPIPGMTSMQMASLLSEGHDPALHILVEDECAKAILQELLRPVDPDLLSTVSIAIAGGADLIKQTLKGLKKTGLSVAAVLDGDQTPDASINRFVLPGDEAPERELFRSDPVKNHIQTTYGFNLDDFAATLGGVDHHVWLARLAQRTHMSEEAITQELARAYVRGLSESYAHGLASQLKEAVNG